MVRLVKGAYWDSEIKRSQERGLDGYPVYTRKLATDVSYLACARRLFAGGAALLPAIRHPQRAYRGGNPRTCRRAPATGNFSACMAWARRSTTRSSAPQQLRSALPRLCAGRQPRGTAGLSGAPPARKRRQHLFRQPHRRRAAADRRDRRRPGGAAGPAAGQAASAHPACRRDLYVPERRNSRGLDLSDPPRAGRAARRARSGVRVSPGTPRRSSAGSSRRARGDAGPRSRRSPAPGRDRRRPPGRSRSSARSPAPRRTRRAGTRVPAGERGRMPRTRGRAL